MPSPEGMPIWRKAADKGVEVGNKVDIGVGILAALAGSGVGVAVAAFSYVAGKMVQGKLRQGYA